VSALTAGHFLLERPLKALPLQTNFCTEQTLLKYWNLVKKRTTNLYRFWYKEYLLLQACQKRDKGLSLRVIFKLKTYLLIW